MSIQDVLAHPALRAVKERFSKAGIPVYLVGGAVRDILDNREGVEADLDLTTPARPEQITQLLSGLGTLSTIGARFGTIGVYIPTNGTLIPVEVTTHRKESYTDGSRKPEVELVTDLLTDLKRRDFTLNAMAIDLMTGEVIDLLGGEEALRKGLLVTPLDPEETFYDDPLRMVRAVRFCAMRGWTLDETAKRAAQAMSSELRRVAIDRIQKELSKALTSPEPDAFRIVLSMGRELKLLPYLLPGLPSEVPQVVLELGPNDRLIALGVGASLETGNSSSGAVALRDKLKYSNAVVKRAEDVSKIVLALPSARGTELRSTVRKYSPEVIAQAIRIARAYDVMWVERLNVVESYYGKSLRKPLPVNGDVLLEQGLSGKDIGVALKSIEKAFIANPRITKEQALALVEKR